MLFDESSGVSVSRPLIGAAAVSLAVLFAVVGGFALTVLRRKPATGREGMIGAVGTVRTRLDPDGIIFVTGELWQATANGSDPEAAPPIESGRRSPSPVSTACVSLSAVPPQVKLMQPELRSSAISAPRLSQEGSLGVAKTL